MNELWRTHDLDLALPDAADDPTRLEWLLATGTGAYAMGTASGLNTRRYHGLLVAATRPPVGRVIALNQMLEHVALTRGDDRYDVDLSACLFRDSQGQQVSSPTDHARPVRFEKGLSVRWTYRPRIPGLDAFEYTRELSVHWKQQAATLRYTLRGLDGWAGQLTLQPMVTLRDFHSLFHAKDAGPMSIEPVPDQHTLVVYRGDTAVSLQCPQGAMVPMNPISEDNPYWFDLYYPVDAERGQDHLEDGFIPGRFTVEIPSNPASSDAVEVLFHAALGVHHNGIPTEDTDARAQHLQPIADAIAIELPKDAAHQPAVVQRALAIASDDFVVDRTIKQQALTTILAGYPWFADWGRDTFIAMPGLLLSTGRFDEARSTLHTYAHAIRRGLVPNRFDDYDDNTAHYNAVDASLWFVNAAMQYLHTSGDRESWDDWLCDAVTQVIDAFIRGTDHDIRMAGDGLITAGSAHTQLTWMDAACDGVVFTPRHGKAVEINALWYNALAGMADLQKESDRSTSEHYTKLAKRIQRAFAKVFWDKEHDYLYDHLWTDDQETEHIDKTIRPNQILVVSLPHSPLPRTRQKKVVAIVREKLLTPFGLRTLPADDAHYHGRYTGPAFDRDGAYHRGTVWPWLIGPYAEAVLRANQFTKKAKADAWAAIKPLLDQLCTDGLGQLHEIHEGDPPHRPVGCIAQAWSVAELLRVLVLMNQSGK